MFEQAVRVYFAANVALLTIIGLTLPLQRPGTAAYAVTVASLAIVLLSAVLSGAIIYFDVDLPRPGGR
jgi:hypothetical protein